MYELISGGGGGVYRQCPIIGLSARSGGGGGGVENLQQSDYWVQFRGLDAFNNGDEFFELQECQSVQPANQSF